MASVLKIQSWLHRYVVSKVLMVLTVIPGRFSITCGKDAGHLMELGQGCCWVSVGTRNPRTPGILPFCALLFSVRHLYQASLFQAASSASCARVVGGTLPTCSSQIEKLLVSLPEKGSPPRPQVFWLMLSPDPVFLEVLSQRGGYITKCWGTSLQKSRGGGIESGHSEPVHTPHRCWL